MNEHAVKVEPLDVSEAAVGERTFQVGEAADVGKV